MNGSCRYGQNCHYLHDYPSTGICWYFQKGHCWFGDHCRWVRWMLNGWLDLGMCKVQQISLMSSKPCPQMNVHKFCLKVCPHPSPWCFREPARFSTCCPFSSQRGAEIAHQTWFWAVGHGFTKTFRPRSERLRTFGSKNHHIREKLWTSDNKNCRRRWWIFGDVSPT